MNLYSAAIILEIIFFIIFIILSTYRSAYYCAKHHIYLSATITFSIAILYTINHFSHLKNINTWLGLADDLLSGFIFAILCIIFVKGEKIIENRFEDKEKLCQDYAYLSQEYNKDDLVDIKNRDNSSVVYPIVKLGCGNISLQTNNPNIIIKDSKNQFYTPPQIIATHLADIFSVHDTSSIYNSLNIRVQKMYIANNILTLHTTRTMYYYSLITNRAADYNFLSKISIRELYEPGPQLTPLEFSSLSNHLGFNGLIESSDGYIAFIKRSRKLSIGKHTYSNSVGASLKTKYALNPNGSFTCKGLKKAIKSEIFNELKIDKQYITNINVIAAYRDCVECGKPQLLFKANISKSAKDISTNFLAKYHTSSKAKHFKKKRAPYKNIAHSLLTDGKQIIWLKKEDLLYHITYNYDGITIDSDIPVNNFIFFNKHKKKLFKKRILKMVPSASASIYLYTASELHHQI